MSLHVYLEGLGVYLQCDCKQVWKCLVSDSLQHMKLLGMKLSRFLLQPFPWNPSQSTEGIDSSRKSNRTHKRALQFLFLQLTSSLFFPMLFLSEVTKPAHPGSYGYWCLLRRYQETYASVHSKSSCYCRQTCSIHFSLYAEIFSPH